MKTSHIALLSCFAVLLVTACKPEQEPAAPVAEETVSVPAPEETAVVPVPEEAAPAPEETIAAAPEAVAEGGRFAVAGIDDEQVVETFLNDLKTAAASNDAQKLASMTAYPFKKYREGAVTKEYANAEELAADIEAVYPAEVKQAIADSTFESLFVNYKGIMIHHGEVWFGDDQGSLKVLATNPK